MPLLQWSLYTEFSEKDMLIAELRQVKNTDIVQKNDYWLIGKQKSFPNLVPVETLTAYIVQVSLGDVQHDSLEYRTIFAAGITLFVFTFILNSISHWIKDKYREKYE